MTSNSMNDVTGIRFRANEQRTVSVGRMWRSGILESRNTGIPKGERAIRLPCNGRKILRWYNHREMDIRYEPEYNFWKWTKVGCPNTIRTQWTKLYRLTIGEIQRKTVLGGETQTSSRGAEAPPTVSHRGSPKTAIHFWVSIIFYL